MNEFNGVADTMLIPMAARIYVSKRFPEYFYDKTALSPEGKIPADALERIQKSSSEYTMLASVARYYNFDEMIKDFLAQHEKCNIVNLGAGPETAVFRLHADGTIFYEIDLPEVIDRRKISWAQKKTKSLLQPIFSTRSGRSTSTLRFRLCSSFRAYFSISAKKKSCGFYRT